MKNLPYESKSSGSKKYVSEKLFRISEVNDIETLLHEMEEPFFNTWKQFEKKQPIGQIITFGRALKALAIRHNCSVAGRYGEELINAAHGLNIEAILKLLKEYPDLIRNIRQDPTSGTET